MASWRDSRKIAEPVQAGGDELGVPGGSGDVLQPGDAVGGLLAGGRVQRRGREGGGGRDACAGVRGRQPASTASKSRWVICPALAYRSGQQQHRGQR